MSIHDPTPTPDELRARIAKADVRIYHVASAVPLHPSRLSQILHGHVPLTPDLAKRIAVAITEVAAG